MASIIRVKRSTGTAAPSSLNFGELGLTIGVGTHGNKGGRLCVDHGDHIEKVNICNKFYTFNGSEKLHWVEPFEGLRYSVVFYNNNFNYN